VFFFVFIGLLSVIWLAAALFLASETPEGESAAGPVIGVSFIGAVILVIGTLLMSVHQVNDGHVGVVYSFGKITDQTGAGIVFTKPWESVTKANVQEQSYNFAEDNVIRGASKETQDVTFTVALNYRISPDKVQSLYREVGSKYFETLVEKRMQQIFKDEAVQYPAIEITTKRDEIREAVAARLRTELEPYSITVVSLQIVNVDYSEAFNNAIEQKQVAVQEALRASEQVKTREYEAQQAAAVAKGEADSQRIRAQGEADANALVSASLTDKILQNNAINKLADNIQIALVPSGNGFLLDPSTILAGAK
jgi:regulator of protease activity HflC (stomatin/prohibitin superfamily)